MNEPPIDERLQLTKMPVLVGAVPAVTPIVSSVVCPGATVAGDAAPTAAGLDAAAVGAGDAGGAAGTIRAGTSLFTGGPLRVAPPRAPVFPPKRGTSRWHQ